MFLSKVGLLLYVSIILHGYSDYDDGDLIVMCIVMIEREVNSDERSRVCDEISV